MSFGFLLILLLLCFAVHSFKYSSSLLSKHVQSLGTRSQFVSLTPTFHKDLKLKFRSSDKPLKAPAIPPPPATAELDDDEPLERPNPKRKSFELNEITVTDAAAKGVIPVGALLGFTLAPRSARFLGAFLGGSAGYFIKEAIDKRLEKLRSLVIPPTDGSQEFYNGTLPYQVTNTLDELLQHDVFSYTLEDIIAVSKRHGVRAGQLNLVFAFLLSEVVYMHTKGDQFDLLQLNDIVQFVKTIDYKYGEIGDGLALAAVKLGFTFKTIGRGRYDQEAYTQAQFYQATKIYFLTDKLLGRLDGFYGKRMLFALDFYLYEEYQEQITKASEAIFKGIVVKLLQDANSYDTDDINAVKTFLLTNSPMTSKVNMFTFEKYIADCLQIVMRKYLPTNVNMSSSIPPKDVVQQIMNISFPLEIHEHIVAGCKTLGVSDDFYTSLRDMYTYPLISYVVKFVFDGTFRDPESAPKLRALLTDRCRTFHIPATYIQELAHPLMLTVNKEHMKNIDMVYNRSNQSPEQVYKFMHNFAQVHNGLTTLFSNHFEPSQTNYTLPLPGLPLDLEARMKVYQLLTEKIQTWKVKTSAAIMKAKDHASEDRSRGIESITATTHMSEEIFKTLEKCVELTQEQKQYAIAVAKVPKVVSWIEQCIREKLFNPMSKGTMKRALKDCMITPKEWERTSTSLYLQHIQTVGAEKQLPTQEDTQFMANLQDFLGISEDRSATIHQLVFGERYSKAIAESLQPSGYITNEYKEGLHRLQQRLLLSPGANYHLTSVALRQQIVPVIDHLRDVWKANNDIKFREEKQKEKAKYQKSKAIENPKSEATGYGFLDRQKQFKKEFSLSILDDEDFPDHGGYMREITNLLSSLVHNFEAITDVNLLSLPPPTVVDESIANQYRFMEDPQWNRTLTAEDLDRIEEQRVFYDKVVISLRDTDYYNLTHFKTTLADQYTPIELIGMYKYYLLGMIAEQDSEKQAQYVSFEPLLQLLFGLVPNTVHRVHMEFTYETFRRVLVYHMNSLSEHDDDALLPSSTLQQILVFQRFFKLNESSTEMVYNDAVKDAVKEYGTMKTLDTPRFAEISPATIRKFRRQVKYF